MSIILNQIKRKLVSINIYYTVNAIVVSTYEKARKINLYPKSKKYFIGYEKDSKVIPITELKTLNEINDYLKFALDILMIK